MTGAASATRAVPAFDPRGLIALYLGGRHDELSEAFLTVLRHFRATSYTLLDRQGQLYVNEFIKHFLALFTQPDFVPNLRHAAEFVRHNGTISNLVRLSSFRTTDPFLELLGGGAGDFAKRLALCSARNRAAPDRTSFFDTDPALACAWYSAYAEIYRAGLLDPVGWKNLHDHFAFEDDRLDVTHLPMISYFASSYVGEGLDRIVRSAINRSWKAAARPLQEAVRNRPDPRKVAVLSSSWAPGHSAYRITRAFVEALRGHYHLTFVPLGTRRGLDLSAFDEVRPLDIAPDGTVDIRGLLDNDFHVAYYPDVGLSTEATLLTNLRLAPVQIASLGHSVSTWGAEVDYMISGAEVEPPDNPQRNYSERLVLLPRWGAVHERPDYAPAGRPKASTDVVINCPWNAQKLNHPHGLVLREIVQKARRRVRLRLFTGASLDRQNDYLPFVRDLEALLGSAVVEVLRELPYLDYMARMEEGDFSLDSFPFGGCNVVVDSLTVRKPMVCREGPTWYNRIGPALLRAVGLPELVVTTDEDYVRVVLRLIEDDAFRADLQVRLDRADLDATVFDRSEARAFRKAVDQLVADHDQLRLDPGRSPIRVVD